MPPIILTKPSSVSCLLLWELIMISTKRFFLVRVCPLGTWTLRRFALHYGCSTLTCKKEGLSVSPQTTVCFLIATLSHQVPEWRSRMWWDGSSAPLPILPLEADSSHGNENHPSGLCSPSGSSVEVLLDDWRSIFPWFSPFLCLLSGSDKRAPGDRNTKPGRQE